LTVEAAFAGTGQTITAGPDGAIWFLLADGRVARLNTSGQVAFFGGNPYGATTITAGPDGAVWFAVQGCGCTAEGPQSLEDRDKLVRITPDGTTKEFPTPEGAATNATPHNGGIVGIAAGPDGALWFTESDDNRIGRMTTSGEFTRYVIPVSDGITRQPQLIVAGPGRAMFFSEATQNVIGRVAVP
jgi:virginiamycin B lyase